MPSHDKPTKLVRAKIQIVSGLQASIFNNLSLVVLSALDVLVYLNGLISNKRINKRLKKQQTI